MNPLSGRHALVTGGGRGIGAAVARRLAELGAEVTITGRDEGRIRDVAEAAGLRGLALDVTDPESVAAAFAAAGPVHILVNNAGIAKAVPFLKTDPGQWGDILRTDLTGPFLCTQAALPGMLAAGWGRVVNIASTAGLKGLAYCAAYCAAKHGLIGLTRALAAELATKPVTVNAICPGYVDTGMTEQTLRTIMNRTGRSREQALAEITAGNPQGRLITPEEVAEAVAWLCLPGSGSVTGQSIAVAGGEVMVG